jgi:hypothetical protein
MAVNKTKQLNLPDTISVTVNEQDGSSFTFQPGTLLSGWDQDFAEADHVYNTGDMEVIRIFVEKESVFVAYLFKDKFKKYQAYNSQAAVQELKEYFYDNLQPTLRKKFKIKKKDLSMVIVPRYAENFGIIGPAILHSHDTAEAVNPIACEVNYRTKSRSRSTESSSSKKKGTRRKKTATAKGAKATAEEPAKAIRSSTRSKKP